MWKLNGLNLGGVFVSTSDDQASHCLKLWIECSFFS